MVPSPRPLELVPDACLFRRTDTWYLATSTQMHALRAEPAAIDRFVQAVRADTLHSELPLTGPLERAGLLRDRRRAHGTVLVPDDTLRALLTAVTPSASDADLQVVGEADLGRHGATVVVVDDEGRGPTGIETRRAAGPDARPWLPWFQDGTDLVVGPLLGARTIGLDWRDVVLRRRSAAPSPPTLEHLWEAQADRALLVGPGDAGAARAIAAGLAIAQITAFLTDRFDPGLQQVVSADGRGWSDHHVLPVPSCA
ncbi:MAG: hypothetical protein JJT89_06470 [Nitriliruptoraceae bacterium]|nr:hypothetical protein [Nitriliruptoraceae bacterium]